MRAHSLILPPLAVLRLKLTSDENEKKDRPAGETREKAALVREEWRFITLPGNNVLFLCDDSLLLMADNIKDRRCQWAAHSVQQRKHAVFPCTVRCFLLLCRGFGCWVDGSDCG